MTNPDWVPTIRRAAALVTDGGGMTCHAAIVSRELGVPCVVGTRQATTVLRTGELVTVDGRRGKVFEGDQTAKVTAPRAAVPRGVRRRRQLDGHRDACLRQPGDGVARRARWPPCRSTAWGCCGPSS